MSKVNYEVNASNESLLNKIKQLEATNKHLIEINDAQTLKIKQLEEEKPVNHDSILIERIFKMNDERFEKIKELEQQIKDLKSSSSKRVYYIIGGEVSQGDNVFILDYTNFPKVSKREDKFESRMLLNTDLILAVDRQSMKDFIIERISQLSGPFITDYSKILELF